MSVGGGCFCTVTPPPPPSMSIGKEPARGCRGKEERVARGYRDSVGKGKEAVGQGGWVQGWRERL